MPSMPYSFDSDGVEIAYLDEGEGEPIFLVHGFASNAGTNWVFPGWVKTLKEAGYRGSRMTIVVMEIAKSYMNQSNTRQ